MRKAFGALVAVAVVMSLIGVAWAGDELSSNTAVSADVSADSNDGSVGTDVTASEDVTVATDDSSSTTIDDTTSTTIENDTMSTRIDDDTRPTTIDDKGGDEDETATTALGVKTYVIADVGTVTIELVGNGVILISVDAPGWTIEVEKAEQDRIEIEFHKGEAEAEFEAELHNGSLRVEIESD